MRADRRLYLNESKDKIVTGETGEAAYLFKAKGQVIAKDEHKRFPELKQYVQYEPHEMPEKKAEAPDKMVKPPENKASKKGKEGNK